MASNRVVIELLPFLSNELKIEFQPAIEKVAYQMAGLRPIDLVCEAISAAHHLGIPFQIKTIHDMQFRGSGNVSKGHVYFYEIKFGELEDRNDED